ncbi:MAG: AAA family ATPase, partial [Clostridiales bacterium]|nr:AAA family ATPase [Clostridiales bacterium]
MAAKEQQIEEQWLVRVLEALNAFNRLVTGQKQNLDAEIEEFWKVYDPHDKGQNAEALYKAALLESLSLKTKLSALALKKPYFARVDFKEDGMSRPESIYLGKMAVYGSSEAPLPLVADWRAPVASLYYDGRLGEAAYDCPDGRVTGEISLKRQYIIENARLKEFFDIDITANDEFLQLALGSSKDKRLKDIVSTIQAEQNQIIRADMHGPVIVQGAAGSGKTTIALHRIAYLLYNYEKRLAPYNVLVVAPNRYFLSYISEVLPDLGVENVKQTTFEDFAFSFIEKRLKIKEGWEKLAYLLSNPPDAALVRRVSRIKSSLWFKKIIERYIEKLTLNLLPGRDFDLCGHVLRSKGEIRRLYCQDYAFLPILKRAVELRKYMQSSLKKRKPELLEDIEAYYEKEASRIKRRFLEGSAERREELTRLYNQRDGEIEILTKKSSGLISDYLKKIKPKTAYEYYRAFFEDADLFYGCTNGIIKPEDAQAVRDLSLKALEGGGCEAEDLAPIMLLHYALDGNAGFDIRHIVIDEAQDMSLFQIDMLKTLMNTGSFTILGDLC